MLDARDQRPVRPPLHATGYSLLFEQINHILTVVHGHPQLFLKCRLPNRISFNVFDQCFCKVKTKAHVKRYAVALSQMFPTFI